MREFIIYIIQSIILLIIREKEIAREESRY